MTWKKIWESFFYLNGGSKRKKESSWEYGRECLRVKFERVLVVKFMRSESVKKWKREGVFIGKWRGIKCVIK